ncbi:hypothetical protein PV326_001419 [Microctonus aethiopoides]|nr:hypothetical protein PV326_001419 [Microctonus aethiopoides]
MTLDQDFDKAADDIKGLTKRPTDDELLELYALFKQSTVGDVNVDRPGMFDLKGKAKWDRWNGKKGVSKDEAKKLYIAYTSELLAKFEKAAAEVKELVSSPSDADLLELYALYKQATVGDCNTTRPGMLDFKGKAKWDAWDGKKGLSQDDAKEKYVAQVTKLIESIGKK